MLDYFIGPTLEDYVTKT